MNIRKKYKVIDVVFLYDEIDYLLFRLTELDDSVDLFIILESSTGCDGNSKKLSFKDNIERFDKWQHKIIYIVNDYPSLDEITKILHLYEISDDNIVEEFSRDLLKLTQIHNLLTKIKTLDFNFDDIFMVSEIDEIPLIPSVDILQDYLSFETLIFSQKDFIWSKDYIKQENHFGTFCFLFSHSLTLKNLAKLIWKYRTFKYSTNHTPINLGYRFSNFNSINENVENIKRTIDTNNVTNDDLTEMIIFCRNNLVYYNSNNDSELKPLKKYDGPLPKNINMLNSQKIGRYYPKKHTIFIENDLKLDKLSNESDSISLINYTDDISSKDYVVISDKISMYNIFKPKQKYYDVLIADDTLENFQKMYFLNEIKKILISKNPIDIDIFEFHIDNDVITYNWSQIGDNFIYDLLYK